MKLYEITIKMLEACFERLLNRVAIAHRGFHSLRHTFATRLLELGDENYVKFVDGRFYEACFYAITRYDIIETIFKVTYSKVDIQLAKV